MASLQGYRPRVNERWVCKRCFADNESAAPACVRCRLSRGADVSAADVKAWQASQSPAGSESFRVLRLLRFWWVPVLAVILAAGWLGSARRDGDGTLTSAGTISVENLQVGDCFDMSQAGEISTVEGRPCAQPHEFEVFHAFLLQAATFPAEAEMYEQAEAGCRDAFDDYVGVSWGSSGLYFTQLTPTEASWRDGDRTVVCMLYDPADDQLTESARGSRR
jgi:ribosomal protein L40E